jgi:general secretion pathway protein D
LHALILALALNSPILFAAPQGNQETWNFVDADIQTVAKRVSEETKKNFVIDPRVQGKITLISQQGLSPSEVYDVFLSVLRVYGYKAIEANNVIKIIPQDSANNDNGPVLTSNGRLSNTDQQVIKVLNLKFISPTDMVAAIRELVPRTSRVMAINSSNNIIIADTASNIAKVEAIIKQVDNRSSQDVDVIAIKHASAPELVTTLSGLLRDKKETRANPVTLAADERTNSIIVSGSTPEIRRYLRSVVARLDDPSDNNSNSEVIYLRYVQASNIAPIIAAYLEEALHANKEESVRQQGKEASTSTAIATSTTQATPTASFPNHLRALKENSETGGMQGSLFEDNENKPKSGIINRFVQWEETTNAIIVKAPPSIMRSIKTVIAKLDIRRPQVIIEVVIAEIGISRLEQLGVEWDVSPNASVKFGTRFLNGVKNPDGTSPGIIGGFSGGTVAELGTGISIGVFRHGNLRALIKALSADSTANILSTPTLVTLDNQTALIKVGEKVPFAVGQTNNQNTNGNPFTSFDREEVGLSLTIKPQIISDCEIKLQIENILSNLVPNSANANTGGNPTTSERTIVTNVLVNEGKILVLGGLIQDSWQDVRQQVPFLGRLPIIGYLFKSQGKELVKKNLMIFLRPKIIHNDIEGVRISTGKYERMRQAELSAYDAMDQIFVDEPVLGKPLSQDDYFPGTPEKQPIVNDEIILPSPFGDH